MTGGDLALARPDAQTHPAFDTDTLRELPAPHLRLRHVNPGGGYLGLDAADIAGLAGFRRGFDSRRAAAARADGIGDPIRSASQISLTATGREFLREHQAFVTIEDVAASFQRK